TGQLPHPGASLPEVCVAVMNSSPRPLSDFLANVPAALEEVLMRCLAKEPSHRYSSVAELAEQLLPFAPECQPIVERAARLLGGMPHPVSPRPLSHFPSTPSGPMPPAQRVSTLPPRSSGPPGATVAPWSKTDRNRSAKRRISLLVAALFGLSALAAVAFWRTRSASAPIGALSSPSASPSTSSRTLDSKEVQSARPTASAVPEQPSSAPADDSAKATGPEVAPSARSAPRKSPTPGAARPYTYFGGRR